MNVELQLAVTKAIIVDFVAAVLCEREQAVQEKAFMNLVELASACLMDQLKAEAGEETKAILAKIKEMV